jgi:hypothetical protein
MEQYNPTPLATDTLDSAQQEINNAAADAARLILLFSPKIRNWIIQIDKWHRDKWAAAVLSALNVDNKLLLSALDLEESVQSFLARNVALVKSVSDQAQTKIADAVLRGYQNRLPASQVAKELSDAVDFGRKRSILIASDQLSKLAATLDRERKAEAGIELFKYRHSGKLHPRLNHQARDGKIYFVSSGKQRGGSDVIAPSDRPGIPIRCGCREQAYLAIQDEL